MGMYRNFSIVPNIMFGRGAFNQLGDIIGPHRIHPDAYFVFVSMMFSRTTL